MIDTHCHLTFDGLYSRVSEVLSAARKAGVDRWITVATDPIDADRALDLADRFEGVYVAVGVHPHEATNWSDPKKLIDQLSIAADHDKVVAMGEMGLDLHYPQPPFEAQERLFAWQLDWAQERVQLPIIIHNRSATDRTIQMIERSGVAGERFVFHCFTGDADELQSVLDLGSMVSFTGIVTFGNAVSLAEISDQVPMERLMVETDSPYLTPEPHRKVRPNEPRHVLDVARFLADRRALALEEFIARVDANARRFFQLC